jgi:hypothetical protein
VGDFSEMRASQIKLFSQAADQGPQQEDQQCKLSGEA